MSIVRDCTLKGRQAQRLEFEQLTERLLVLAKLSFVPGHLELVDDLLGYL
jgi:hypothetical protein